MKILMLAPLFHPHIGGVEKHVRRVSEELVKKGHEVDIITVKHDPSLSDAEKLGRLTVHRFPNERLDKVWGWLFRHRALIQKADIVHCHDFVAFIYWYLPFRFLYPFKPVFVTFHGFEGVLPIPKGIKALRKIAERLTRGNICIGDYIPKWYGTRADFVLYGGVDEPRTRSDCRAVPEENSAVFVGRLAPDTGIMAYIEAVRILKVKYGIGLSVEVCGDGPLRPEIEAKARENGLPLRLHGQVEDPTGYLAKGGYAFTPGYLSILEAMALRRPVFTVYENEIKKDYLTLIPGSENIMVSAPGPGKLAEKLACFHRDPGVAGAKVTAARDFAGRHTWEAAADIYLKLWGRENG